jgi:hypothetical protein
MLVSQELLVIKAKEGKKKDDRSCTSKRACHIFVIMYKHNKERLIVKLFDKFEMRRLRTELPLLLLVKQGLCISQCFLSSHLVFFCT